LGIADCGWTADDCGVIVATLRPRVVGLVAAAGLAAMAAALPAQDAQQRAADRLRALQAEADQLLAEEKTLLVELRTLEVQRDLKLEQRRAAQAALAAVTAELTALTARLESLERTQAAQVPGLSARLAEVYKLGSGGYLRLLLNVNDVREMGRAYRTVAALAALDRERVRAHQTTLQSLRATRTDLQARRTRAAALDAEARAAAAAAARAVEARTALIARIDARRDLNAQLAGELEAAQRKLATTVTALTPGTAPALPFRPFRGALDWPAAGRLQSRFGVERSARFGAVARSGIEIAATAGAPVVAVHEGTVAYAAPFTGFGPLVILDHGDRAYTLYGYLESLGVTKGARVEKGAAVGTVGMAPGTGAPALYFEVRVDGKPTDPLQWLKPRTQRFP
jgi:septal ring factor EnvC (AmiA/AmiB activator)